MSNTVHYYKMIPLESVEVVKSKLRRLMWDDANEAMALIEDAKIIGIKKEEEEENENQEELFKNKFSGTGDRNEKEKPKEALPPTDSGAPLWGGDGTPVY